MEDPSWVFSQHLLSLPGLGDRLPYHPPASLSAQGIGNTFCGSLPAGPQDGEDMVVHGLAQHLTPFFSDCNKAQKQRPKEPGLTAATRNNGVKFGSSGRRGPVLLAGQALNVLRVPGRTPKESPKAGHSWLTQLPIEGSYIYIFPPGRLVGIQAPFSCACNPTAKAAFHSQDSIFRTKDQGWWGS